LMLLFRNRNDPIPLRQLIAHPLDELLVAATATTTTDAEHVD
jgi:hypothetical protein